MKNKFEKTILYEECEYGNLSFYMKIINTLLHFMQETNKVQNHDNECFRIEYRPSDKMGWMQMTIYWGYADEEINGMNT